MDLTVMATPIQLGHIGREAARHHYTPIDVRAAADTYAADHGVREVYAYLLQAAADLSALTVGLTEALTNDTFDPDRTHQAGLHPYRRQILAEALTCAHNAAVFLHEAQRRPDGRVCGYDPLTTTPQ